MSGMKSGSEAVGKWTTPPSVVLMYWLVQHDLVLGLSFPVGVQAKTMNSELPGPNLSEVANYNLIHRCSNELSLT